MPAAVYKQLIGDTGLKNLGPVQCTMRVYTTQAITNLESLQVFIKYPGRKPKPITFNITNEEALDYRPNYRHVQVSRVHYGTVVLKQQVPGGSDT